MKTVTKLLLLISCLILIHPVSAEYNISAFMIGDTYIAWQWDTGLDITDLYINGQKMCGYESTQPMINVMGMTPCTEYNITIVYNGTSGTDISTTTCGGGNGTVVYGSSDGDGGAIGAGLGVVGGIIGGILVVRRFIVV